MSYIKLKKVKAG